MISNCCGAEDDATSLDGPSFSDIDICPDCREHCEFVEEEEEEEEEEDCCVDSSYGFRCTCIKKSYKDDDDYGDYAYEQYRDGLDEEEKLNNE